MNFFSKIPYLVLLLLFLSVRPAWVEETGVAIYFSRCPDVTPDQYLAKSDFILTQHSRQTCPLLSNCGVAEDISRIVAQLVTGIPIAGQSIAQTGYGNTAVVKQGP